MKRKALAARQVSAELGSEARPTPSLLCLWACLPGWCRGRGREGRNSVLPIPTQAARPCPCSGSISVSGVTVIRGLDAVATAVTAAISGTASDSAVTDRSGEEVFNTKND